MGFAVVLQSLSACTVSICVGGEGCLEESVLKGPAVPHLQLNARFCHGPEGISLPVDLLHLLPHDHVEAGAVLVAEDEASVVIVSHRVDVKRPLKVDTIERCVTCGQESTRGLFICTAHSLSRGL